MRLDVVQARVVGSLIEKQLTTPQQYPLTLNALVAACNQATNRDPVLGLDEPAVSAALESLKAGHLVRFVLPSHGRSVVRYRQVVDESLGLDLEQLTLFGLLLLRGPQTLAELRSRSERLATFDDAAAVGPSLESLSAPGLSLAVRLPRRPGQKEERWSQTVTGDPTADGPTPAVFSGAVPAQPVAGTGATDEQLSVLAEVVQELVTRIDLLEQRLGALQDSLGG